MTIPESQLEIWSRQGATVGSAQTYNSIQTALASHPWHGNMDSSEVYLQGSYRNHTNIRGDSDVDTVAETGRIFCHNLTPAELRKVGWDTATFTWADFNNQVYEKLVSYYGARRVTQGNKCINVVGQGGLLNADVVPCCEYRRASADHQTYVSGITFFTQSGAQIINYPKLHHDNGARKNSSCNGAFKRLIRVFKNARNHAQSDFSSYFLECLLYNVADSEYVGSYDRMFCNVLSSMCEAAHDGSMPSWWCQNRQQEIFGTEAHQTQIETARALLIKLVELWENWP